MDKGHGRLEKRTLTSTTSLSTGPEPYLDWPCLGQCFKLVRERINAGDGEREVRIVLVSESESHRLDAEAEAV